MTKLQDMPEEILQHIMLSRLPSDGIIRLPDLQRSSQIRSFAGIHPSFYNAYRDSYLKVTAIHAVVPGQKGNFVYYGPVPRSIQLEIAFLANLIGSHLKVLHVPNLQPEVERMLLEIIPKQCPEIEELHFSEEREPASPYLSKIVMGLPKLRVLKVVAPSHILFAIMISKEIQLQDVTFENLPEECLKYIQPFLETCGRRLVRIAFTERAAVSTLYGDHMFYMMLHRWSYKFKIWTPCLSILKISIPTCWHLGTLLIALRMSRRLIARFTRYCQLELETEWERQTFPKEHLGLSRIDILLPLTHELVSFFQMTNTFRNATSYTIWRGQPKAVEVFHSDFRELLKTKKLFDLAERILSESSETVTELISVGYVAWISQHVQMLKYYGGLLPNVSTLTVSADLISDSPNIQYLTDALSNFKHLRALHLIELDYVGSQVYRLFHFLLRFSDLADTIESICPKLETLTIQKPRLQVRKNRLYLLESLIREARRRLEKLEDAMPHLDASTVRLFLDNLSDHSQARDGMRY